MIHCYIQHYMIFCYHITLIFNVKWYKVNQYNGNWNTLWVCLLTVTMLYEVLSVKRNSLYSSLALRCSYVPVSIHNSLRTVICACVYMQLILQQLYVQVAQCNMPVSVSLSHSKSLKTLCACCCCCCSSDEQIFYALTKLTPFCISVHLTHIL